MYIAIYQHPYLNYCLSKHALLYNFFPEAKSKNSYTDLKTFTLSKTKWWHPPWHISLKFYGFQWKVESMFMAKEVSEFKTPKKSLVHIKPKREL